MATTSITTLAALVGRTGTVRASAFRVDVRVLDVKQTWGNVLYLVTPLAGSGQAWVTSGTFKLTDEGHAEAKAQVTLNQVLDVMDALDAEAHNG